ncbi:hypothetical protein Q1695_005654 [Nippostrongylus brasiliensis]|nr:hypothetical protein Q1695_005654 [Nippostrongylus brasiliensis]
MFAGNHRVLTDSDCIPNRPVVEKDVNTSNLKKNANVGRFNNGTYPVTSGRGRHQRAERSAEAGEHHQNARGSQAKTARTKIEGSSGSTKCPFLHFYNFESKIASYQLHMYPKK